MEIKLQRASLQDAELILSMQKESFLQLYEKYRDADTNPANESIVKVKERLLQSFTYYYLIKADAQTVGAIRVVDKKTGSKRTSPLFVLPAYRNLGIAQMAIHAAEEIHGSSDWELETIAQEEGLCRLYEKLGYRKTGKTEAINDKLTLVFYKKA